METEGHLPLWLDYALNLTKAASQEIALNSSAYHLTATNRSSLFGAGGAGSSTSSSTTKNANRSSSLSPRELINLYEAVKDRHGTSTEAMLMHE